jgi:two-component system chemotaxis sensor kinase CheA
MDEELQRQLIEDFVVQSTEELAAFDRELLALETRDSSEETLRTIFRVIHTIKGTAGCIGLGRVERLAHMAENVLSRVQRGTLDPSSDVISTLLRTSDRLNQMVRDVERTGKDDGFEVDDLVRELEAVPAGKSAAESKPVEAAFGLFVDDDQAFGFFADEDATPVPAVAAPPVAPTAAPGAPSAAVAASGAPAPSGGRPSVADNVVRVDVAQLDALMNLVGELVLTRNQILASSGLTEHGALGTAAQRLNVITSELQERVMKTRMQPIGNVWAKFPRTVRDLAADLGKRVRLVMDGQATELDRTILDAIRDPLTHLVRNSIDHGLETPSVRRAAGKPDEGLVALRAYHEGGQVVIEIMDDGRGIDVERVKAKAVQNGVLDAERAARLSAREAMQLIFLPGFSTAEQVTNVSGRGVGMDVVRSNIERTGGSIELQSDMGQGTTIRLRIPLTLAIIPALIVSSAGERFAIPQMSLVELVRLERGTSVQTVELLAGRPVYRLRGRLLPLVSLATLLGLAPDDPTALASEEIANIVVLQSDGQEFGLVVEAINDTEEIVVKPLGKRLKQVAVYAGATIMGDGRVALILDASGLAHHAAIAVPSKDRRGVHVDEGETATQARRDEMLLCRAAGDRRIAIPLGLITRLEEIDPSRLEWAGGRRVLQYRGHLLPVVEVAEGIGGRPRDRASDETVRIIVVEVDGVEVGLVVDRIDDIVQDAIEVRCGATATGLLGSAVIGGQVTDLLDVPAIVRGQRLAVAHAA